VEEKLNPAIQVIPVVVHKAHERHEEELPRNPDVDGAIEPSQSSGYRITWWEVVEGEVQALADVAGHTGQEFIVGAGHDSGRWVDPHARIELIAGSQEGKSTLDVCLPVQREDPE